MESVKRGYEEEIAKLQETVSKKKEEATKLTGESFSFYAMLLGNEQHLQWEAWVKELTNHNLQVNLQGTVKKGKHGLTLTALICVL